MFKFQAHPTFTRVVAITRPGEDAPGLLEITFKHHGRKAFNALMASLGKGDMLDVDLLMELVEGWNTDHPEHGAEKAFSREALDELLDEFPAASTEMLMDYRRGMVESRIKNS